VAPVFDPATRTAELEIEVPNASFRLKPGMYARVQLTVGVKPNALTVPSNAIVTIDGKTGVFIPADPAAGAPQPASATTGAMSVRFQPVDVGIRDGQQIEITSGLDDGARVITTGSGALRDGDQVLPSTGGRRGGAASRGDAQRPQAQGSSR
jgi:HlyD family secretion protein